MDYETAKRSCHVRSGIYRTGDPSKKIYWKNNEVSLDSRVPGKDKLFNDWEEYDPREQPECSAFNEMPA